MSSNQLYAYWLYYYYTCAFCALCAFLFTARPFTLFCYNLRSALRTIIGIIQRRLPYNCYLISRYVMIFFFLFKFIPAYFAFKHFHSPFSCDDKYSSILRLILLLSRFTAFATAFCFLPSMYVILNIRRVSESGICSIHSSTSSHSVSRIAFLALSRSCNRSYLG